MDTLRWEGIRQAGLPHKEGNAINASAGGLSIFGFVFFGYSSLVAAAIHLFLPYLCFGVDRVILFNISQ